MKNVFALTCIFFSSWLCACNNPIKPIDLVDASETECDSINLLSENLQQTKVYKALPPESNVNFEKLMLVSSRPSLLSEWKTYIDQCLGTSLTKAKNLSYLGINNEYGVGTIFSKHGGNLINQLYQYSKYFPDDIKLDSIFRLDAGTSSCNITSNKMSDINADISVSLNKILSLDAKLRLLRIDSTQVTVTSFKKQYIQWSFVEKLASKNIDSMALFFNDLYSRQNVIITQAYLISNYNGVVHYSGADTIGVGVKLDSILSKVTTDSANIHFIRSNSGTISASFSGSKFVVGYLQKVKKPRD